jgi:hypothetical protein
MSDLWLEVGGEKIDLNQSRIQFFLNCKRKYMWQFEENLVIDRPQFPLKDGTACHAGLEALYGGATPEEAVQHALDTYDRSFDGVPILGLEEKDLVREHRDLVERLTRGYVEHYGQEEDFVVIQPEVSGRVEVGDGTGVFLIFRTDGIISMRRRLWLLETKTMARLGKTDLQKYEMDLQLTSYIYAVRKSMGQPIAGVLLNALVKTKEPRYHRELFLRTDKALAEFEQQFVEMAREIAWRRLRIAEGEDPKIVFYQNTQECFRYGVCAYRPLCLEDDEGTRLLYIKRPTDYVDEPTHE